MSTVIPADYTQVEAISRRAHPRLHPQAQIGRRVSRLRVPRPGCLIVGNATIQPAEPTMTSPAPASTMPLPPGIRSRFVDNINGLRMHVLEAGFEAKGRPCLLLLHGFPELAYSWRKVMLPLAAAGFHVVAPDQRGYGRTTGWDGDLRRRPRLVPPPQPGEGHAGPRLGAGLPFRRRRDRARLRLAGGGLVRAAAAGRVPLGGADERAVRRPAGHTVQHDRHAARHRGQIRPHDPRRPRRARPAAQALPLVLLDPPCRCRHAPLPAGRPRLPARLLPPQERGLESQPAAQARSRGARPSLPSFPPTTSWSSTRPWPRPWRRTCRPPPRSRHADGSPRPSSASTARNTPGPASRAA